MSLDVYLEAENPFPVDGPRIFIREGGETRGISRDEWERRFPGREPVTVEPSGDDRTVYSGNITHNLGAMAGAAGLYGHLWRPDEIGIVYARQLIEPLTFGLARLLDGPDHFKAHNPPNGWGTYEGLVRFVEGYLLACKAYPNATVRVWR
jgi:hypothetical protein